MSGGSRAGTILNASLGGRRLNTEELEKIRRRVDDLLPVMANIQAAKVKL